MTLDADSLAERRRLKRRLSWWRIAAILAIVGMLAVMGVLQSPKGIGRMSFSPQIARVNISGMILDDRKQRELLETIGESKNVKAVIVHINSPGGTTTGGEALYLALRKLAKKKPIVAVFGTSATSAAYLAGISTDYIVARGNSITGSVGVVFQWPEVSDLLKNWGIRIEEIRSGPLKAVPSPFAPTDDAGRRVAEEIVNESRDWFVQIVKERRKLNNVVVAEIKTGRIYTGRQALKLKLIDAIGDEETAKIWLEEKRKVSKDLDVVEWKVDIGSSWYSPRGMANSLGAFLGAAIHKAGETVAEKYRFNNLDGLTSLWHPQHQQ
ncbi:MAG: signal peptide peptidase SppA [Alphaproteobacteria bacterium]